VVVAGIYYAFIVPESPKWLYTWLRFDETRNVLKYVARYNLILKDETEKRMKFKFEAEVDGMMLEQSQNQKSVVEHDISTNVYVKHLVIFSI
jgi:hypothetical protein